jgi:hypothetical protein
MPKPLPPTNLTIRSHLIPNTPTLLFTAIHILKVNGYPQHARILETCQHTERVKVIAAIEGAGLRVLE